MSNAATHSSGSLQGSELLITTDAERTAALNAAFDYRGDVTLHLQNGNKVEGYVFNRDNGIVKLYIKGSNQPQEVPAKDLLRITFDGKDPADGKSYENWKSKKSAERKEEAQKVAAELKEQGYL